MLPCAKGASHRRARVKHWRRPARLELAPVQIALEIAALWAAFTATHLGLASARVEHPLRARLGNNAFLGLYSLVALAIFVPLVRLYFTHRHAGEWLWAIPLGPGLRAALYAGMTVGLVLSVGALVKPSPAAVAPGSAEVAGIYRVTRHPLVLGLALIWALHLIPNASAADVAFFGGFVAFSLAGAWHQDARKLAAPPPGFAAFHGATAFLPFTRAGALRGLREVPPWVWALGLAAAAAVRWLHPRGLW
jgi:uncharacterized membrane protein